MANLLHTGILLGLGALSLTKEKAEQMVEELTKKGELQREEGEKLLGELMARGEKQRQEFTLMVQREMERLLSQADVASKRDLALLEERIAALEEKLKN